MASKAKAHVACKALPGATYDVKWGKDECYSVGGKMFAVIGPGGIYGGPKAATWSIAFKVEDGRFLEITDVYGIIPAPYLAKHKWVLVQDPKALTDAELNELIVKSHALIVAKLPKKVRESVIPVKTGIQAGFPTEPAPECRNRGRE